MREPVEDLNRVVWNEVSDEQERCRASLDDLGSAIVEEWERKRKLSHSLAVRSSSTLNCGLQFSLSFSLVLALALARSRKGKEMSSGLQERDNGKSLPSPSLAHLSPLSSHFVSLNTGVSFVLLISRQGKVRLAKWYTTMSTRNKSTLPLPALHHSMLIPPLSLQL